MGNSYSFQTSKPLEKKPEPDAYNIPIESAYPRPSEKLNNSVVCFGNKCLDANITFN